MKSLKAILFASLMLGSLTANAGQPAINISIGGEFGTGIFGQIGFNDFRSLLITYNQPEQGIRYINHIAKPNHRKIYEIKRSHAERKHIRHARNDKRVELNKRNYKRRGNERRTNRTDKH